MARLNDRFMDILTDDGQTLKLRPEIGYVILEQELDGITVEVRRGMWHEPHFGVRGEWSGGLTKGGIKIDDRDGTIRPSDIFDPGLHTSVTDAEGDRRFWIPDTSDEEVLVSTWDPHAPYIDPEGFPANGLYGDFVPAAPGVVIEVKQNAQRVLDAARIAVEAHAAS